MVQIGTCRAVVVEPTLWPRMLAVVAIALAAIVATLVLTQVIDIRWGTIRAVGIHIPYHTIAFVVGTPKGIPKLGIRDGSMTFDDIVQGHFQLIA